VNKTEIVCPKCKTVNEVGELVPHAENFCAKPGCDFPLFWDQMSVPFLPTDDRSDGALRRLPGVAGRDTRRLRPCLQCAEPNLLSSDSCIRCGAPMDPPPPPPPPEEEPTEVIVEPGEPLGRDWLLVALFIIVLLFSAGLVALGIDYAQG